MQLLLGVAAFLLGTNSYRTAIEKTKTANDRRIVAKQPVAMQFMKMSEEPLDVVGGVRAFDVPRQLHTLPSRVSRSRRFRGFWGGGDRVHVVSG